AILMPRGWRIAQHCIAALCITALSAGCAGPQLPDAVTVRVDRVDVSAMRPGTEDRWDGYAPPEDDAAVCSLLAAGTRPVAAEYTDGMGVLCGFMRRKQQPERDRRNPDLQVRLSAGSTVRFDSFVESDVLS